MAENFPTKCSCCERVVERPEDLDWHGLGNCVPVCERCNGSGIEPTQDTIKESYDRNGHAITQNLAMLVRRLCYKHPNEKLVSQALGYLRGENLLGNILRESSQEEPR